MRRALIGIAVVAAALAAPAAAHAARLSLAGTRPVALRGAGFHARERVTLRIRQADGRQRVRHVTASRAGTFRLAFPAAPPPCGGWSASATGSRGSRAFTTGMEFPDCIVS